VVDLTMSVNQPHGYRLANTVSLTGLSRRIIRDGASLWRDEAVRAIATVLVELLDSPDDRDRVFQLISHGQVAQSDLVVSVARHLPLVAQAAEFIDVLHAVLYRPSAIPIPPGLDLRFRVQFYDDSADPEGVWTYVLVGTNIARLEEAWQGLPEVESFPVPIAEHSQDPSEADPHWTERPAIWDRVLEPYRRSSPISWSTLEPQCLFDVEESQRYPDRDADFIAEGKITARLVIDKVISLLREGAPDDLYEQLTRSPNLDQTAIHEEPSQ
jgi:hypothetical protein